MHFSRSTILTALLVGLSFQPLAATAGISEIKKPSSFANVFKNTARAVAGIGLGLIAHIATELPIIITHEYGHYLGNLLTGGKGGRIEVECNLLKHPLAAFMPFFARFRSKEKHGNRLVSLATGPLVGIAANYGIMVAANAYYALRNGATQEESLKAGLKSPLRAYTSISDAVAQMIVEQGDGKMPSFSEIFMMTFNLLKTSKMFGEFIYGLTPFSIDGGDGQKIWQELGLKKDMTVEPLTGFSLALIPLIGSIAFGIAKGVYTPLKAKECLTITTKSS